MPQTKVYLSDYKSLNNCDETTATITSFYFHVNQRHLLPASLLGRMGSELPSTRNTLGKDALAVLAFREVRGVFTIEFTRRPVFSHEARRALRAGDFFMRLNVLLRTLFCSFSSGASHSAWHIGDPQKVFTAEVEYD